jgi:DNA-binding NarL/FixJ family response regulator
MDLLGQGYANRDIAEALGLREGTIRIYVHRVIRQLGMRNRVDVALCASRMRKPA